MAPTVRRSLLFTPGDNEHRMVKALTLDADAVCFDLEDAVAPEHKEGARRLVAEVLRANPATPGGAGPERVVRINALDSDEYRADLSVVIPAAPQAIMVPKAEDPTAVTRFLDDIGREEASAGISVGTTRVLLIFETALGVLQSLAVARAAGLRLSGVLFGAEDLAADVGMVRTSSSNEVLMARSTVALTGAACRVPAMDQVFTDIQDTAALEAEAMAARKLGYAGKMAIHPGQLAPIHRAFTPSVPEVQAALALLKAAREHGGGVFRHDGRMIDQPLITQAERVIEVARKAGMFDKK